MHKNNFQWEDINFFSIESSGNDFITEHLIELVTLFNWMTIWNKSIIWSALGKYLFLIVAYPSYISETEVTKCTKSADAKLVTIEFAELVDVLEISSLGAQVRIDQIEVFKIKEKRINCFLKL